MESGERARRRAVPERERRGEDGWGMGRKEVTRWPHLSVERREGGKRVAGSASAQEEKGRRGEGLGEKAERRRGGKEEGFCHFIFQINFPIAFFQMNF